MSHSKDDEYYIKDINLTDRIKITDQYVAIVDNDTVIVADIHLGFESVLNEYGVSLPRFELHEVMEKFTKLLTDYPIKRIILNGDFKHDFSKNSDSEWNEITQFLNRILTSIDEIILVKGNHDNFLSTIAYRMGVTVVDYYDIGNITVFHGDRSTERDERIIIGHEHPSITFRDRIGAMYTMPIYLFFRSSEILVLPAFSAWTYGSDVLTYPLTSPVIRNKNIDEAEVYGIYENGIVDLTTIKNIKKLIR